jgi:hypothetical protein
MRAQPRYGDVRRWVIYSRTFATLVRLANRASDSVPVPQRDCPCKAARAVLPRIHCSSGEGLVPGRFIPSLVPVSDTRGIATVIWICLEAKIIGTSEFGQQPSLHLLPVTQRPNETANKTVHARQYGAAARAQLQPIH